VGVSVLLRQPHGFEGPRMTYEVLLVEDPTVAYRVDDRKLQIYLGSSAYAPPGDSHDNSVAGVDELTDCFDGVGVPRLSQLLELAHDCVSTAIRPLLPPILIHPHDGVRVVQLTKGIHVTGVPRLEHGPHDLHVLLRHRLVREARGVEARRPP